MTISSQSTISVGTSAASFLPSAADRVGLIVSSPTTNRITLSLYPDTELAINQGLTLHPGMPPLMLTRAQYGDLVTRAWTAIGAGAETIGVIEIFER